MNIIEKKFNDDKAALAAAEQAVHVPTGEARHAVVQVFATADQEFVSFRRIADEEFEVNVAGFQLRSGRRLVVRRAHHLEYEMSGPVWEVVVRTRWSRATRAHRIDATTDLIRHCEQTPTEYDPFAAFC